MMQEDLLGRLQDAVDKLLERNRQLSQECCLLREEKAAWQQEKSELLGEVDQVLKRLDSLDLEDS